MNAERANQIRRERTRDWCCVAAQPHRYVVQALVGHLPAECRLHSQSPRFGDEQWPKAAEKFLVGLGAPLRFPWLARAWSLRISLPEYMPKSMRARRESFKSLLFRKCLSYKR